MASKKHPQRSANNRTAVSKKPSAQAKSARAVSKPKAIASKAIVSKTMVSKSPQTITAYKALLERNKKVAVTFYNAVINKKSFDEAVKYIGNDYVQHNPTADSGVDGLKDWMETFHKAYPNVYSTVRRVIAEDDIVVLHNESQNGPGGHRAIIDMLRVKDGKVIEHWDVIQVIPANSKNSNSMF